MSRSKMLYQLQQMDSALDKSQKRIQEIDALIKDHQELDQAVLVKNQSEQILRQKQKSQQQAEEQVAGQNQKIDQNQKKLYSGAITNPKELEDLQLEYHSLTNYLSVLEERQLAAMLETEQAQEIFDEKSMRVKELSESKQISDAALRKEKETLELSIKTISKEKDDFSASCFNS
jgi:predicted  nucleic acid-binding Zn-ribbon protein